MPLIMLLAFPAVVLGLLWMIGETGIEDDAGWTAIAAFFAAIFICVAAAQKWEQYRDERRRRI